MKRTQLLLIMLLTLASSVWAANAVPSSLAFQCSQKGSGTLLDGGSSDKCITDGLFEWSVKGEDELKWNGEWVILKTTNPVKGRTRSAYHFQAGTYRFTFHFKTNGENNIQYYEPQVSLNDGTNYYPASPASCTSTESNKNGGTFSVDVAVASEGDYKVRVQFRTDNNGEKVQYSTVDIALQGGGNQGQGGEQGGGEQGGGGQGNTPSGNCTNTLVLPCYEATQTNRIEPDGKPAPWCLNMKSEAGYGSNNGFAEFRNCGSGEIFYFVSLPQGTYSVKAFSCNGKNRWMNIYQKNASGETISYGGSNYGKIAWDKLGEDWTNQTFAEYGRNSIELNGDYIIGLYAEEGWAAFEKVVFTATTNVFCPPAAEYAVTFNNGGHGTLGNTNGNYSELTLAQMNTTGWVHSGWTADQDVEGESGTIAAGETIAANAAVTVSQATNFTAVWTPGWKLMGNWDSYTENAIALVDDQLKFTKTLEGNTTYWIRLSDGVSVYRLAGSSTMNKDNCTEWDFYKDNGVDCGITTTAPGEYTFIVDDSYSDNHDTYGYRLKVSVIYPASVAVNFNYMGKGGSDLTRYIVPGTAVEAPVEPHADGFSFAGWYEDEACTRPFDFETTLTEDITLYASWTQYWYYHEEWTNWDAHLMTESDDHTYWYWYTYASDKNREFKLQKGGVWYGRDYNDPGFNCTDIENMNSSTNTWTTHDNRCAVNYNGGRYYIIVYVPNTTANPTDNPIICASTTLPDETSYTMTAGHTLYFDNSQTQWNNIYYRIGRKCHNTISPLSLVTGTQSLYKCETTDYNNYDAFHFADNVSWSGDKNSIYKVDGTNFVINHCTDYLKETVSGDLTFVPNLTTLNEAPYYYSVEKHAGLLTHNVAITEPSNGTISVAYTDIDGNAQNMTSGNEDLAHTCILTITATPTGAGRSVALKVNGEDFTSGDPLVLSEDVTISATFPCEVYDIHYELNGGTNNVGNPDTYTVESAEITLQDPTKDGYDFQGWYADSEFHTPSNTIAARSTGAKTFYAKWAVNPCTNTLTIQCEDNPIKIGGSSPEYKLGDGWHSGADGNYVDYNNNAGKELFYAVSLPAGTYTMTVRAINAGQAKLRFYKRGAGSDVTYNTNNYGKLDKTQTFDVGWTSQGTFSDYENNVGQLDEGEYLLGLYADGGYACFDKIVITSNTGNVFCPTMYTVTFEQPANGSVSAAILDGEVITSGAQVLEGTRVEFTCTPDDGYDFVKYNDGTSDITDNPYTVTVNSDLTITTTIEQEVAKHHLTASADANGSVSPTALEVGEGRETTITATPDANYRFDHWEAVGYVLTGHENDNPLTVTMPTIDVALTAYFVFDEVHNMIATGTSANYDGNQEGDGATLTITAMSDPEFDHDVMKFEYSNMSGHYAGKSIFKDGGYTPTSKATGFAFWYKTEKADDQVAFCFQKDDYQQVKWQLAATNGVWKYYYFADAAAANYSTGANLKIYMNGEDNGNTTRYNEGAYYITEIQATNVTAIPDYTITLDKNGGQADGTATATLHRNTLTGVTHVERTGYDLTGYFTATSDGTKVINADGTLVANVDGYTDGSANWTKESDATLYAQWQAKETHVTAQGNGGRYQGGGTSCNGNFPYGCSAAVECFPTKDEYNFLGYTLTQDGDDYIFDKDGTLVANVANYTDESGHWIYEGATLTIYAKWISSTTYYDISVAANDDTKGTVTMTVGDDAPTSDQVHVIAGTKITLNAECSAEGYAFKQWQDGNRDKERTITATETATYTATFARVYTVTAHYTKPGVEVTGQGDYFNGDQVTLTAVAGTTDSWNRPYELQYELSEWTNVSGATITGHEHDNPITFTMSAADVEMTATYAPVQCTNTKTIQCEENGAYIGYNDTRLDNTNRERIPHVDGCGVFRSYYTNYHGTGYYDYKTASNSEMFYPVTLPAGTYQFVVWAASNTDKNMWMNVYVEDPDGTDITYIGTHYRKAKNVEVRNYGAGSWPFAEAGTISGVTLATRQSVIVGLYAGNDYAAFDQIVITADNNVFCEPISTEQFIIRAGEIKEVPVCGVANLTIYEGGQANNVDDFEVTNLVEYKRTTTALDKWETFCVPFDVKYAGIKVWDEPDNQFYEVYPTYFPTVEDRANNRNQQNGYFFLEELADRDQTVMGEEFKQRWEVLVGKRPMFDNAYILKFPSSQSNGYFRGKEITYSGGPQIILGKANGALVQEVAQDVPKFYYYPNNTMSTLELDGDAYILNEAGTNFDLQTNPVIKPFSCYIQATEEYKAKNRSLRMTDALEAEQGSTITTGIEHTDWTIELLLRDPDTRIYDMLGRSMSNIRQLPTGVYTLVNGDYSVKYVVK